MLVDPVRFERIIDRMAHQLLEHHDFKDTDVVGLQTQGARLAERLQERIQELLGGQIIRLGKLDVTFHRDDVRMHERPLSPQTNDMPFLVEGRRVILVDDVLYTGRTIQAALAALQHYGRPSSVELLVLVDRRFNRHLPIQADYIGISVDAVDEAYVRVRWQEIHGEDQILLYDKK